MKRHPCKVLITAAAPRHPAGASFAREGPRPAVDNKIRRKCDTRPSYFTTSCPGLVFSLHWRRCEERGLIRHHLSRGRCCCVAGEGQWCHQLPCGHHWVTNTGSPASWSQLSQWSGNILTYHVHGLSSLQLWTPCLMQCMKMIQIIISLASSSKDKRNKE